MWNRPKDVTVNPKFISAARAITCCIDLWCDVDRVINIALLLLQDKTSKKGNLREDEASKKLREDRLKK